MEHPASLPNHEANAFLAHVEGVPVKALPHLAGRSDVAPTKLAPAETSPALPPGALAALPGKVTPKDGACWKFQNGKCSAEGTMCPFGRTHTKALGSDPSKRGKKGDGKNGKPTKAAAAAAAAAALPSPGGGGGGKPTPPDPNSKRSLKKAQLAASGGKPTGAAKKKAKHM